MTISKRVILLGAGQIKIDEIEVPKAQKGAMIMKMSLATVCGSELHHWAGVDWIPPTGVVWGHEGIGTIYELGEGVATDYAGQPVKVGDRVVSTFGRPCGKCWMCVNGQGYACTDAVGVWLKAPEEFPYLTGTFADYYYVDDGQAFYKVPDSVSNNVAATANCALSHVLYAIERMDLKYYETIAIQGAGGLGLNAVAVAKSRGARVITIEGVPGRIELAKKFGADEIVDMSIYKTPEERREVIMGLTGGRGVDVVLDVAPSIAPAFKEAINMLRPGGRLVDIGDLANGHFVDIDPSVITLNNITIIGLQTYPPNILFKALKFLENYQDRFPFGEIVAGAEFPLENVVDAIEISKKRGVSRACIVMK